MAIVYGTKSKTDVLPSLDLRFSYRKDLIDSISGKNLINFSRVQSGTSKSTYFGADGILKYADSNEPRFDHDPTTGESLGLLVEEARANLFTDSVSLQGTWTVSHSTSIPAAGTSPDGTLNTSKLIPNATLSQGHYTQQTKTTTTSSSFSVYAKADGYNYVWLWTSVGNAMFDLSTGTVSSANTVTANVTPASNGWYRLTISGIAATSSQFRIYSFPTSSSSVYSGDGTSGVLLWGAQLEEGSFPTSYIPTAGSTVTRAADVAQITGTNFSSWYNQGEGSLLAVMGKQLVSGIGNSLLRLIAIANSDITSMSAGLGFLMGTHSGAAPRIRIRSNEIYSGGLASTIDKWAWAAADNNMSIVYDGSIDSSSVTTTMPLVDRLNLFGTCTISRLTYYPVRLPDATLQTITS